MSATEEPTVSLPQTVAPPPEEPTRARAGTKGEQGQRVPQNHHLYTLRSQGDSQDDSQESKCETCPAATGSHI